VDWVIVVAESMKRRLARITRPLREDFSVKGFARMTRPWRLKRQERNATAALAAGRPAGPTPSHIDHARLISLEGRVERLQAGWNQHVPGLLDSVTLALSEARGADRVHARIDALREDMDRLAARLDLGLLDLKARLDQPASEAADGGSRIVSMGAVAEALAGDLSVQFVDGDAPKAGFVVVSRAPAPGVDVVAPEGDLSFGQGRAKEVVVETGYAVGADEAETRAALAAWFDLLEAGGKLSLHRFDMLEMAAALSDGSLSLDDARGPLTGGPLRPSPAGVTADALKGVATGCGFRDVRINRSKASLGYTLQARRPTVKSDTAKP
jgi:hypothetical protein